MKQTTWSSKVIWSWRSSTTSSICNTCTRTTLGTSSTLKPSRPSRIFITVLITTCPSVALYLLTYSGFVWNYAGIFPTRYWAAGGIYSKVDCRKTNISWGWRRPFFNQILRQRDDRFQQKSWSNSYQRINTNHFWELLWRMRNDALEARGISVESSRRQNSFQKHRTNALRDVVQS